MGGAGGSGQPKRFNFTPTDEITRNDQYGAWTDPPFVPDHTPKPMKKQGMMRWLDPDFSIVRWVKHFFSDEDDEIMDAHHHHV